MQSTLLLQMRAPTESYTLSLHDALPISWRPGQWDAVGPRAHRTGQGPGDVPHRDRKSTRLNSSHPSISYAVFCLKKKKNTHITEFCETVSHAARPPYTPIELI